MSIHAGYSPYKDKSREETYKSPAFESAQEVTPCPVNQITKKTFKQGFIFSNRLINWLIRLRYSIDVCLEAVGD